jgi:uncharacterized phage protein (TIGR01671 family)
VREILFRGKRIDNGEWIEGYFVKFEGREIPEIYTGWNCYTLTPECYGIERATVGQYTGLTDKNGKKVFEGDICRMKADRLKGYGAIIFMGSAFVLCDKAHKKTRYYPLYADGQFTVVGNIHDNPELLEVTE